MALPELFLCGYPPEDLALKPALQAACRLAIEGLARETADGGPALLIGTPWLEDGKLHNAYCLLDGGAIAALRFKVDLPNYGVFDDKRVFVAGPDAWPSELSRRADRPSGSRKTSGMRKWSNAWRRPGRSCCWRPTARLTGATRTMVRLNIAVARVTESDLPIIYVNQVGGQDELVFDGASFGLHGDRSLAFQLPAFREAVQTLRWERIGNGWRCVDGPIVKLEDDPDQDDYSACVLGLRDYVDKNGFKGCRAGPVGRHRFCAGGGDLGGCARTRARALRDAAVPLHLAAIARTMPPPSPRRSASITM